jgi:site-specific recombinase XerC
VATAATLSRSAALKFGTPTDRAYPSSPAAPSPATPDRAVLRPVHEVQVDLVDPQPLKAPLGFLHRVLAQGKELGRDEHYSKQSKAFLAWIGGAGAVSGLDAGKVTAFMMDWTAGRNTWTAKAMVTSLRAFLRFAHATGRTAALLAGAVPSVASWRMSSLPRGMKAAEIGRLLAGCDRDTAMGLRDYAILSLLARLGLRGAEAAGLRLGDIDWRAGEITVTGKGSRTGRLPLPAPAGRPWPPG